MSSNFNAKNAAVSPAYASQTVEAANAPKADLTLNMNDLNRAALPSPAYPFGAAAAVAQPQRTYAAASAAPPSPSGGFRATVPPSPAHGASTAILGSGSHQEMTLPLSEAAPELFGGNPAASTPHYDALAAAGTAPAQAYAAAAAPAYGGAANPIYAAAPAPMSYGGGAPMAGGFAAPAATGLVATVPPSPAHAGSTAMLGSGSHQEMVLPLSEAAPELFGGNPAASTPHYDAVGEAGIASGAPMQAMAGGAAAAPFISAAPVTATPMNYAATPSYNAAGMVPPSPSGGLRATVPPSPAHAASTTMLGSGSHQEMTLPLSEAAPELFGGNPAASTPHYDAMAAADTGAPGIAAAAGYMGGAATPFSGPAVLPPIAPSSFSSMPGINQPNLTLGMSAPAPAMAGMPSQFPHITGFNSVVPPSPAHAASSTMVPEGGHQEMVLPLSEAAPELFGGNPGASTPHYDAVMGL